MDLKWLDVTGGATIMLLLGITLKVMATLFPKINEISERLTKVETQNADLKSSLARLEDRFNNLSDN